MNIKRDTPVSLSVPSGLVDCPICGYIHPYCSREQCLKNANDIKIKKENVNYELCLNELQNNLYNKEEYSEEQREKLYTMLKTTISAWKLIIRK